VRTGSVGFFDRSGTVPIETPIPSSPGAIRVGARPIDFTVWPVGVEVTPSTACPLAGLLEGPEELVVWPETCDVAGRSPAGGAD
jgi:hypothetical protein